MELWLYTETFSSSSGPCGSKIKGVGGLPDTGLFVQSKAVVLVVKVRGQGLGP